jgi:hypothetical protein
VWQTADWAFTKMTDLGLTEQLIISHVSYSLFTRLFVLRPMALLTIYAAIFHKFASSAYLQFYAIRRCFVTVSTYFVRLFVSVGIIVIVYIIWTATNHEQRDIKEHHEAEK